MAQLQSSLINGSLSVNGDIIINGTILDLNNIADKKYINDNFIPNSTAVVISGSQTSTSSVDGGSNVYTFTDNKGKTSTFTVKNGSKGSDGAAAGFGTPIASVDSNIGTPSVTITSSGSNTAKVFNFAFKNLKGETGRPGNDGATGLEGLGIFKTSEVLTTSNVTADKRKIFIPSGRSLKIGDLLISGVINYLFKINEINGNTVTIEYLNDRIKGDTGDTGHASTWHTGTGITGTSTTGTAFSNSGVSYAYANSDLYLNTSTYNLYLCTTSGNATNAKWTYKCNIKGATGVGISSVSAGTSSVSSGYTTTPITISKSDGTSTTVNIKAKNGTDVDSSKYLPLAGGTISGNLNVLGNLTVGGTTDVQDTIATKSYVNSKIAIKSASLSGTTLTLTL